MSFISHFRGRFAGALGVLCVAGSLGACGAEDVGEDPSKAGSTPDGAATQPDASAASLPDAGAPPSRGNTAVELGRHPADNTVDAGFPSGNGDASLGLPGFISINKACDLLAKAACQALALCAPSTVSAEYGKVSNCEDRNRVACLKDAALKDSGFSAVEVVRCANETMALACPDLLGRRVLTTCQLAGNRHNSMVCASNAQCKSGFCAHQNATCGICQGRASEGQKCLEGPDDGCMPGLRCTPEGLCRRPGGRDAPCNGVDLQCQAHLACIGQRCVPPLGENQTCSDSLQCNVLSGQYCGASGSAGKAARPASATCQAQSLGLPGDLCAVGGQIVRPCQGGIAHCLIRGEEGLCQIPARDGELCGPQGDNRACISPARCTAGTCALGPAAQCDL